MNFTSKSWRPSPGGLGSIAPGAWLRRSSAGKSRPLMGHGRGFAGVREIAVGFSPPAHESPRGWQMIAGEKARAFSAEESPNTTRQHAAQNARGRMAKAGRDGKCHRKQTARVFPQGESRVRVKRRGKSPPPGAQAPGHDKPHAVQDITGSAGRLPAARKRGSFRVLVAPALREGRGGPLRRAERNDHHPRRATAAGQNSAYRQPHGKALSARRAPSPFSLERVRRCG